MDIRDGVWAEPDGAVEEVLGEGLFALAGLVDGHAHFAREAMDLQAGDPEGAERRAAEALEAGVMLAFDKGWRDLTSVEMTGRVPLSRRPDIEAAGRIHAVSGGYFTDFAVEIVPGTFETAMIQAATEAGWIKLVGDWPRKGVGPQMNFDESELAKAVSIAEERGARVAVHTMARETPSVAVRAGVHSIEHGLFLTEDDLGPLGERGGYWVPTMLQVEDTVSMLGADSSGGRLLAAGIANTERLLPLAAEAGVRVLAGTDLAVPTSRVAEEVLRMHRAGLTSRQAIAAASCTGLDATGRGGFQEGKPADAVLFPANPLDDLGVLAHPAVVIRHGVVL